jgi:hypothetical protein
MISSRKTLASNNTFRRQARPQLGMQARRRQLTAHVVADATASGSKVIFMYTKPGCELCDGTRVSGKSVVDVGRGR